jgi:hypothetical protein
MGHVGTGALTRPAERSSAISHLHAWRASLASPKWQKLHIIVRKDRLARVNRNAASRVSTNICYGSTPALVSSA